MTGSEVGLNPKRSQQKKSPGLRKITIGQHSGWSGRDKFRVRELGQRGGCRRNGRTGNKGLTRGDAVGME